MSHFSTSCAISRKPRRVCPGHAAKPNGEDRTWSQRLPLGLSTRSLRSTHGVNCRVVSWKIYVRNGIVTWETQQTDYPAPVTTCSNHEPRGCARARQYSWYFYSANRPKYPLVRGRLLKHWRAALSLWRPVDTGPPSCKTGKPANGKAAAGSGGFARIWDEVQR